MKNHFLRGIFHLETRPRNHEFHGSCELTGISQIQEKRIMYPLNKYILTSHAMECEDLILKALSTSSDHADLKEK